MNTSGHDNAALPLEELDIVPQWVRAPLKNFENHSGQDSPDRSHKPRRRDGPPRSDRGPAGPGKSRPPKSGPRRDRFAPAPNRSAQPLPPAPVEITFLPEEKGLAPMIEAMKKSPRAYSLFDLARLVLNKPERHIVRLKRLPAADGTRGPLHLLIATGDPYLSLEEAVRVVFRRHGETVCREHKQQIEPPKGNFTFVNRCGITGVWLGPPNYHEYQSRLVRHHQQRLRHVPFEEFKGRIQTVRDPESVKAWIDAMSVKAEYECLLCGDAEPRMFASREEVQAHAQATHLDKLVVAVEELHVPGEASRKLDNPAIMEAARLAWQNERRFPLKTAHELSPRLNKEGFHFFKDLKGITWISHIKPRRFDNINDLTQQLQQIMTFLRINDGCTHKDVLANFVPRPPTAETPATPSAEEDRVLADLYWLIQAGYVVEFSNGKLWALKDKPPRPTPPPPQAPASPTVEAGPVESAAPPVPPEPAAVPDVPVAEEAAPLVPVTGADPLPDIVPPANDVDTRG